MRDMVFLFTAILALVSLPPGFCEEGVSYPCYRLGKEPVLDGKVKDDDAWKNVPVMTGFVKLGSSSSLALKQTCFKMGYNSQALYIGVECEEREIKEVLAGLKDMQDLWGEDSIEIFISPEGNEKYFQFIVNAIGSRWCGEFTAPFAAGPKMSLDGWRAEAYKGGEDYWSIEAKIPFEVLKVSTPQNEEVWTGNIARNIFTSGDRYSCWTHLKGSNHEPYNFGKVVFKDKTLSVKEAKEMENEIHLPLEDITKKEIGKRIKLLSTWKADFIEASKNTVFQTESTAMLEACKKIEREFSSWDKLSLKEKTVLYKENRKLFEDASKLRGKILIEILLK